jgi:hypothetical protein
LRERDFIPPRFGAGTAATIAARNCAEVGRVELVVGLRSHTGEVLSVYLTDVDVEKLSEGTA